MTPDVRPRDDLDSLRGFERFHRDYFGYVWTVLVHLGVPDAVIDDAHQEVFLTCYRRRDTFRPGHPVKPWLVGIARRVAFRHRRSQQRRLRKLAALAAHGPVRAEPEHQVEARILLERFIAALDPARREAFILAELEGRSGLEIAEALGISVDAAYARVRQARLALTRELTLLGERPVAPARVSRGFALLLPELHGAGGKLATWGAALLKTKEIAIAAALTSGLGLAAVSHPDPPAAAAGNETHRNIPDRAARTGPRLSAETPAADTDAVPVTPAMIAPTSQPAKRSSLREHVANDMPFQTDAPEPPTAPPARSLSRLGEEAELLARAQRALGAEAPVEALRHLDAYAQQFPAGALHDAAIALKIEALCAQGRRTEARTEASALLRTHPHAAVARKAAESCALEHPTLSGSPRTSAD